MCPATIGVTAAAMLWASAATAVVSAGVAAYSANQKKHAAESEAKIHQSQINDAAGARENDRLKAAREARATARVASAEAGVSGNTVNDTLNDITFQSGRDVSRIDKNRENGIAESNAQLKSAGSEINGQLYASYASAAETFASDGTQTYYKGLNRQ